MQLNNKLVIKYIATREGGGEKKLETILKKHLILYKLFPVFVDFLCFNGKYFDGK